MTLKELINELYDKIVTKENQETIKNAKIVINSPDGLIDLARIKYDEKENEIELEYD